MNKSQAILTVLLATSETEPLAAHVVAARVLQRWPDGAAGVPGGMDLKGCGRSLSQMYARGRVSRVKTKAVAGYCYFLTEAQRARCFAPVVYPHAAAFSVGAVPAPKIIERIRFLQRLQGLPAFAGEAVIDAMLDDYSRAHKAATSLEEFQQQRVEDEMRYTKLLKKREGEVARKAKSREKLRSGAAQHEIV